MAQAKDGDTVRVNYTGKLTDGTVFDSSAERDPLQFTVGAGQVIPGFDHAVVGMNEGDKKSVEVAAEDAYGNRRDDLLVSVDRGEFPNDVDPRVGQRLQAKTSEGNTTVVKVAKVEDERVTLDANHPLAGEKLAFDIELVQIV